MLQNKHTTKQPNNKPSRSTYGYYAVQIGFNFIGISEVIIPKNRRKTNCQICTLHCTKIKKGIFFGSTNLACFNFTSSASFSA